MAAIETSGNRSLHVDLTPMVDLGFLLITFFILTTALQNPVGLKLILPDDRSKNDSSETPASKTLSLVLADNSVGFYKGNNLPTIRFSPGNSTAIRAIIEDHINTLVHAHSQRKDAVILIKPTNGCTYAQLVNCLDEMTINDIKKYVVMDATKAELQSVLLKQN